MRFISGYDLLHFRTMSRKQDTGSLLVLQILPATFAYAQKIISKQFSSACSPFLSVHRSRTSQPHPATP